MSLWSHLVPIRACKKKLVTTTKSSGNNNNLAPASNGHSMASLNASSSDVPEKNSHIATADKLKSAENVGNGGNVSYPTKPGGMAINGSSKVAPVPNKMPVHIQMGKGLATSAAPAATTTLTSMASNQVCSSFLEIKVLNHC